MLKWFSGEEGGPGSGDPGSPQEAAAGGGEVAVAEITERLVQTEQLVTQLKDMIREKDAALHTKDEQLKVEKETYEAKLSKLRLQNKAKVTSLTTQLEDLKKQQDGPNTPTHSRKGMSEGGEQASRGKIVLLKKKVEELEQQLAQRDEELVNKRKEVETQQQRGEEMDVMLTEKDRKLAEKEAYIVHLQTALAGDQPVTPAPQQVTGDSGAVQELQLLVQSLTRKVGEAEERYSLLQEQTNSLKKLLATEKEQYSQKETMYKQNIQTFKDIMLQKDNQLMEINKMHEQELFRLAAKSDASADLEQLLKALKQKLHEKEEVLLGKTQVIDVLQAEVDGRDQQIKDLSERLRRLQVERESLESKMEAEKHVMRAQLRDLLEKQQAEVQRMTEHHQAQMAQIQQDLLGQLEELRRASAAAPSIHQEAQGAGNMHGDSDSIQRIADLEAQTKQKADEASRSEAKFLKMKAWSKSRIRQLEEELKKTQAGVISSDVAALRSQVTALEEEREENIWKVEQYDELKAKNDMLEAKLVVYEEQQRTLQADLEQFTKRAASQASESGSADDTQSQVLEWQEMVAEAINARDRAKEEKTAMVLRISHMEEEREAMATRQQELEEELTQARGLSEHRVKKLAAPAQRSLQEDFDFHGQAHFQDPRSASESTTPMEGENMGGWWPEYSTPDTDGLRSVVEELELERNQLQEQILSLEERCQDLEDRLQLQARIETLQNESEKLQSQLASVKNQQSRDAEKHQLLVSSLNEQLKGLSDTQECLETSLIEKENTLAKTSEKLELISSLRESLSEKEIQLKDVSDKLLHTEHTLENVSKKSSSSEKQCSELKTEVVDLTQKLSVLRDKTQKLEVTVETLQAELDQTNEDLDKLNTAHLEERAQLIHDLQSCEREIDSLKDILLEKDKEIATLTGNMAEYAEQVTALKQEIKLKEENLVRVEDALSKVEREAKVIRDSQSSDQQALNGKITELIGKLQDYEAELVQAKDEGKSRVAEVEQLIQQAEEDKKTIQDLRGETQRHVVNHRNHLSECQSHITSLKEQLTLSNQRLQESEGLILQLKDKNTSNEKQLQDKEQTYERELKSFKDEHNQLLAQLERSNSDVESLSRRLEQQAHSEEQIKQELQQKLETIATLENQIKATDSHTADEKQKLISELQVRDSENHKLSKEVESKSESISKLKNLLKNLKAEKQQLQEKLKGLTEELQFQKHNAEGLNEKVTSALELNNSLEQQVLSVTKENGRLELEVTESSKTISESTAERDSLQARISILETQFSENSAVIQRLEKEKEDLTARASELNQVLEQSANSNSEILLAKTNECSHLSQLLREKEDQTIQLQQQVQSFTSEIDQLRQHMEEKEQIVADLKTQVDAQRIQLVELQETLLLLREQESALKSGLLEKDTMMKEKQEEFQSLQNEMIHQRNCVSKLQAEVELLSKECSHLTQQLEGREEMLNDVTDQCQKHKDELNDVNKTVQALSDQINVMEESTRRFRSEAEKRQSELTIQIQTITDDNQQLQAACKSAEKEIEQKTQTVSELDDRLRTTLEQNSGFSVKIRSLTEENQRLQEELAKNITSVSELTTEVSLLQEKKSGLEAQMSDNQKYLDDVMTEKEQLAGTVKEFKQSETSFSACLVEKNNECANLSKMLNEREEQLQNVQRQVSGLELQVSQLNVSLMEKEQVGSEMTSRLETQQDQLLQLQDTVSLLQEQGSVLKSALAEKDMMLQQKAEECSVHQNEVLLQKGIVSEMQTEVESVRRECSEAKRQLEQKDETLKEVTHGYQSQKDELDKRSESVISLSSQLGVMNTTIAETEVEVSSLKNAVQKLTTENAHLLQEGDQRKAQLIDLTERTEALNDQNTRLKAELQRTVTELAQAREEVMHVKSAVCDKDARLQEACSEKEQLHLTVQGTIDSLKQQENVTQELSSRIAEQEELLRQKSDENTRLRTQITDLEESVCKLRDEVGGLNSESSTLKSVLEKKEQSSLEYQNSSSLTVANLKSNLQAKEEECESMKEEISHLEESIAKINSSLQTQISETEKLRKALEEKESGLSEQSKSLLDLQRRADEALLFRTQLMESTETVSQLQSQIHLLSSNAENHRKSAEETQRAFDDLQDKHAASLEELQDVREQLSRRTDETSTLQELLDNANRDHQTAVAAMATLTSELSSVQHKLEETRDLNTSLSKEKEEAFASHQASVSQLTVEIERLKSQHLQVAAQMNALTENLEQREMALRTINSQYTAQAKHTSQLVSEKQMLEEQNKKLSDEIKSSEEEHQKHLTAARNENTRLQEDVRKQLADKEELEVRVLQMSALQGEQRASSMSDMEKMESEKERLQAKVSAQDEELSRLNQNIRKIEQILQDSEKEWLLVLDREKQDKNLLAERLESLENEMKSKDVKVIALKQDLDKLQEKLSEAVCAIRKGSDQLSAKESEASTFRIQLETVLASVQEKENENIEFQQAFKAAELELHKLLVKKVGPDVDSSVMSPITCDRSTASNVDTAGLERMIKQVESSHRSELNALQGELEKQLEARLSAEAEKMKEATVKYSSLFSEFQASSEQMNCMSIQVSQQKELIAGLTQQLREKDASIAQVIESASNERMKHCEEQASLKGQVDHMEQAYHNSEKQLAEISLQLEERISSLHSEIEIQNSEKLNLVKEKDNLKAELARVVKERDALKKKLQAALVVRKELLKKIEESEKQHADYKTEVSQLRDQIQETSSQAQATAEMYEEKVSYLKKKILENEGAIADYETENKRQVEQLESEKHSLQTTLNEKEASLSEMLQTLGEKSALMERLQTSAAERQETFEQDRNSMMQKLEEIQAAAAAPDLEKELTQMKQEKAMLQKKTQAALVARKETMKKAQENEKKLTKELAELKDDYKALLEQQCQQTNELNAVQLTLDSTVGKLEDVRKTSLAYLDELDTLRQVVEERDKTVQDLKISLAEKERQCLSLVRFQTELETVKSELQAMSLEVTRKDEALRVMKQTAKTLKSKQHELESDLVKAQADAKEQAEEVEKCQERLQAAELASQQEKQLLWNDKKALQAQLKIAESTLKDHICVTEEKHQTLVEENKALSEDVLSIQKTLADTQQQLGENKRALTEELEKVTSEQEEKEKALRIISELRVEITTLEKQLTQNAERHQEDKGVLGVTQAHVGKDETDSTWERVEDLEAKLKQRDEALSVSHAEISEKEQLIAALELQLQQQVQMHESAIRKLKTESEELQKSQDSIKVNDQDSQSKITLLTRKLQAALVARKDLLKENTAVKEEIKQLSATYAVKEAEYSARESLDLQLKEQNQHLESLVSSLSTDKETLSADIIRFRTDNGNLSAACESLKQTIENITQQKQAFSCQLESLKDSQAEELTKWKSKHSELKQEYESLLQAYENVGSEMDKMRQLLEGAKRDRQEALRKLRKQEAEMELWKSRVQDTEDENERIKEEMLKLSSEQRQTTERPEESQIIKNNPTENDATDRKDRHLESEFRQLKEESDQLREKLSEMQTENHQLKEASPTSENSQSKLGSNMQLKLDEAFCLNNSLTAQIEAQKTELGAQLEINNLIQREKQNLSDQMEKIHNDYESQLRAKDDATKELQDIISRHSQETLNLNERVRILEDDKSLLQEELENTQEVSDKVKNENEYLETVILQNSERIDELTACVGALQTHNTQLSSQLAASKEMSEKVRQEKEKEQLKLVQELEEKLKTVKRGNEGSKNVNKELQELLKEKHWEINQLQQNCIKYQEVILDLERSLKTSESGAGHLEEELKKSSEKITVVEERWEQVQGELISCQKLLREATAKIDRVQSERDELALERKRSETTSSSQQDTDETQRHSYMENQVVLQQQIKDLTDLKERESKKVHELKQHMDSQDLEITSLKRAIQTNEAKLSALSSTPEGGDAAKRWEDMYQKTLHEKDNQLLEQGFVIRRFLEDMRVKDKEVGELQATKSRLERTINEYSVASAAQQRQLFVLGASNAEFAESMELMSAQLKELSARVERTEEDRNTLSRQLSDKEEAVSQMQLHLQYAEKARADTDAQLLILQSQNEKFQTDLEKQAGISVQLKTLLQSKDTEISSLLSCRDGHISGYLEQLQMNHRTQVAAYDDRVTSLHEQKEKAVKEVRGLEAKVRSLQMTVNKSVQEKEQTAAKMESFKNSLVSLQTERERLMSQYRLLEAKSRLGFKGKEGSPDGEGGATKGLKHEIRKLLHQMDDLNSENAMLRAQLIRYREDLNQVLSLKDNQLKVLLKKQQEAIKNLENQKAAAEKQHRESRLDLQREEEAATIWKAEVTKLKGQVAQLEGDLLSLKTTNQGKVIADLRQAVAAKAAECNDLQQKQLTHKKLADELKEKTQLLEKEMDKKLGDAEDKYNSELDAFEREVALMRSSRETADQRVSELAKELLEMERQLSEARSDSKNTRSQKESLCKAMAALQNDRDQLIEDFKILRNRYDEELRETQASLNKVERSLQDATSDLAMFSKERDILVQKLKALESKDSQAAVDRLSDELVKALSEKEKQLKQVVSENDMYSRQLSALSRSMASLQNDRDRLFDELAHSRQGSRPENVSSTSVKKSDGSGTDAGLVINEIQQTLPPEKDVSSQHDESADVRPENEKAVQSLKQDAVALAGQSGMEEAVRRLEAERIQLHRDLQRCIYEIQQRDQYLQQLSAKLQQTTEEKAAATAQLRSVSQTLRDSQNRCHWLENQVQGLTQGSVSGEVAPGAPQERSNDSVIAETAEASQLRERLLEVEQSLSEERTRREAVEEALRLAEDGPKSAASHVSRDAQRDFSIDMETEEEWEALSLNPNQPLITQKVKGGLVACRQWLRGRSLYFSRLLTSRARSRYVFLAYLLTLHVLVLMCLTGAL